VGQFGSFEAISKGRKIFSQRRHGATFENHALFFAPLKGRCEKIISFETASFNLYCF
jgi:hypothetical protein